MSIRTITESNANDILALASPSFGGELEIELTPDAQGEIRVTLCDSPDCHTYLGSEERKALVAWLTAVDGAPRVAITEEAIEAFDVGRNGSESAGNIREGLRGALEALGFEVEE